MCLFGIGSSTSDGLVCLMECRVSMVVDIAWYIVQVKGRSMVASQLLSEEEEEYRGRAVPSLQSVG